MSVKKNSRTDGKRRSRLAPAACWTARPETPRTDAAEKYVYGHIERKWTTSDFSRLLEMENAILCDFINREMKMTAADPRVTELAARIAALSNDGADLPRISGVSQPQALPIKRQRE